MMMSQKYDHGMCFGDLNHGLNGSTSCCISHGPSKWERAIFDPPQLRDPSTDFHEIWNIITTFRTRPRVQNFRGLRRRGWSGQIASLTHESFCPLFSFLRRGHICCIFLTQPRAQYVIIRRSGKGNVFWGLKRWNLKFDPLQHQKT